MAYFSDTQDTPAKRGFVPPQNEDERFLMRRVEELCRTAMQRGIPRATGFLSDREQALAQAALNREGCNFARFQGGWPDAERKVLCIEPPDSWPEEPVAVLHFTAPQQGGSAVPGHRDYLGAILGLGLDRACLGDILPDPADARSVYAFVLEDKADFIASNLTEAGRSPVHVERCDAVPEEVLRGPERQTQDATVPSLRADTVLAAMMLMALAGCSKGDVTKEVNSGLSDLKAQAAEPAVEPQTETPAEPKTDAASEPASEPAAEPEPEATAEPAPASAPADNPDYPSAAGLNTQTLEAFGTDFTLVLNVTCPDQGWYKSASTSFGDLKLFPTDDPSHIFSGDPRITFELKSGLDKINYYYDSFENVEELTPRTIGGVEMAGRTYKNVGMWWTEYYGEMPTGGWLAIKISGVDIDPGTEGDIVLNSVTFG